MAIIHVSRSFFFDLGAFAFRQRAACMCIVVFCHVIHVLILVLILEERHLWCFSTIIFTLHILMYVHAVMCFMHDNSDNHIVLVLGAGLN